MKFYKIICPNNFIKFQIGNSYVKGTDTLQLLEQLAQEVYDSYNDDWNTFKAKAEMFQNFVATLFPENKNQWNGYQFTSRSMSNQLISAYLINEAIACLGTIAVRSQYEGQTISTPDYECFTTANLLDELSEENYVVSENEGTLNCPVGSLTNEYSYRYTTDILAAMDTYIATQNAEFRLINGPVPTYKP